MKRATKGSTQKKRGRAASMDHSPELPGPGSEEQQPELQKKQQEQQKPQQQPQQPPQPHQAPPPLQHQNPAAEELVTVTIPEDDSDFEDDLREEPFNAIVVKYVAECDGYVVRPHNNASFVSKESFMVPGSMVSGVREERMKEREARKVQYRIANRVKGLGGKWVDVIITEDLGNEEVLLRLPDYDASDWWSGYQVCKKDSKQIRQRRK